MEATLAATWLLITDLLLLFHSCWRLRRTPMPTIPSLRQKNTGQSVHFWAKTQSLLWAFRLVLCK